MRTLLVSVLLALTLLHGKGPEGPKSEGPKGEGPKGGNCEQVACDPR